VSPQSFNYRGTIKLSAVLERVLQQKYSRSPEKCTFGDAAESYDQQSRVTGILRQLRVLKFAEDGFVRDLASLGHNRSMAYYVLPCRTTTSIGHSKREGKQFKLP
jgi:hypothetical protein